MTLNRVDHVALAVQDLAPARRFYGEVLGLPCIEHTAGLPAWNGDVAGTPLEGPGRKLFFPVGKSAIALFEAAEGSTVESYVRTEGEGVHHLCFELTETSHAGGALLPREDHLGLGVALVAEGKGFGLRETQNPTGIENIDHVVIASGDSAATAAHFRDHLGLEIKRTMTRPGTSSHLEFGKLVDVILEFAGPPEPRPGPLRAKYWGIVFTVADIHDAVRRTRDAGIRCDDPKAAVQPGAMIAGVKESTGGVPFAFIQYNALEVEDRG